MNNHVPSGYCHRRLFARFMAPLLLLVALLFAANARAQSGLITGIITDASGNSIVDASIDVFSDTTNVTRTAVSDKSGYYTVSLLPQGAYSVTIRAAGFQELRRNAIHLEQSQVFRMDATLQVSSVSSSIEVTSQTPALDRETSAIGTVVESKSVVDLPLNGRNASAFASLVPGTKTIGASGTFQPSAYSDGRIAVNGGSPSANAWFVDGIADENQTSGGFAFAPSADALQEVQIMTHTPNAEYGRLGGGAISFISKSGSNEYHGSLWEFTQNSALNSNDYFTKRAGRSIPPMQRHQYGITFGGPILHKKLFYFGNWEGFRQTQKQTSLTTVPTDLQRNGDFSQTYDSVGKLITIYDPLTTTKDANGSYVRTAFTGNVIPSNRISAVAKAVAAYYPEPNIASANSSLNNYFVSADTSYRRNDEGLRMDYYFSPTKILSGRYTYDASPTNWPQAYGNTVASPGTSPTTYVRYSTFVNYSDAISPTLLSEARIGVNVFGIDRVPASAGFDATKLNFPSYVNDLQQLRVFPYFGFVNYGGIGSQPGDRASQRGYAYTIANSYTMTHSQHSLKMGGEGRLYQWNSVQGPGLIEFYADQDWTKGPSATAAASNGYDFASFMLGNPSSGVIYRYSNYEYSTYYYAGYVQDDWKLTRKLTANIGLRWDHESATTARHNNFANFNPNITTTDSGISLKGGLVYPGVNGLSRGNRDSTWDNFGPRVGLAYSVTPSTVVRIGFGIYYLPTTGNFVRLSDTGFSTATTVNTAKSDGVTPNNTLSDPFPNGVVQPSGSSLGALTGLGIAIKGNVRNLKTGTSQQWSFNIEQQLKSWVIEAGYIGNHGLQLPAYYSYGHLNQKNLSLGASLMDQVTNPYASIISSGSLSSPTIARGTLLTDYSQFTGVTAMTNWAGSNYQAGTLRVQRKYRTGLSLLASYTWSKYLDNNLGDGSNEFSDAGSNSVQNWDNLKAEKAISTSSQPNRVNALFGYDIHPIHSECRLIDRLANGWRVNGILTAFSGDVIAVTAPSPSYGGFRPNLVGNPKPARPSINSYLNASAFQTISSYTFGNSPRNLPNYFTQPTVNLDAGIAKTVSFSDRYRMEIRGEAFNVLNITTFGDPGTYLGASSFGVISGLRNGTSPRVMQFGVKGYF